MKHKTAELCQHKDTRSVAEGLVLLRCNTCGAGKTSMGDWCGVPADNAAKTEDMQKNCLTCCKTQFFP